MPPFKHLVSLLLAFLLSACISLPEISEPEADGGSDQPPGTFTLAVAPPQMAIPQGGNYVFQVSVTRKNGFAGDVSVGLLNPPSGITAQPITLSSGNTTANLLISVAASVEPGVKTVAIRGTAGSPSADASLEVTVLKLGDLFVRWGNPIQDKVYTNGTLALSASVEGGTADSLEFLKGGTVLAQLTASPYQFTWDTTQEAEGSYQIVARAKRGSSMFTSTVLTVVVDRTAPTFVSRTPLPSAPAVSVKTSIEAVFSEPLKAASVTNSSVVVSTGSISSVAKTLSLSPDGTHLTISPSAPFTAPSAVTISVGTSTEPVTDLAGNPVPSTQPWTFTIPEWLPAGGPLSAVTGATSAENVAIQIGPDGNPVIAWSESDGSSKNIYVQKWNGTGWQALGGALSDVDGADTPADHPVVVIDTFGRITVLWDEATGTSSASTINLHARQWTGLSWEPLPAFPAISNSGEQRHLPTATFDTSGTLFVSTTYYNTASTTLEVFQLDTSNNSWAKRSLVIPSDQLSPGDSSIATYGSGKFYLAYDAYLDSKSTRGIGAITESWVQLGNGLITNPSSKRGVNPKLAINANGVLYVAWQETAISQDIITDGAIYAARWNGSWEPVGISVSTSASPNIQPFLATGLDGNPIIAWSEYIAPERTIRINRWTGATWQAIGPALSALSGSGTDAFKPVLATDSSGQLWLAWQESDGSSSNIYTYRLNN